MKKTALPKRKPEPFLNARKLTQDGARKIVSLPKSKEKVGIYGLI